MENNHRTRWGMQEEVALILILTLHTNTIYIVIYWVKIVFSLCLQRDKWADIVSSKLIDALNAPESVYTINQINVRRSTVPTSFCGKGGEPLVEG